MKNKLPLEYKNIEDYGIIGNLDTCALVGNDGVRVEACIVCSDSYGITGRLRETGITVKPMGKPLTDFIKGDWKVVTF